MPRLIEEDTTIEYVVRCAHCHLRTVFTYNDTEYMPAGAASAALDLGSHRKLQCQFEKCSSTFRLSPDPSKWTVY